MIFFMLLNVITNTYSYMKIQNILEFSCIIKEDRHKFQPISELRSLRQKFMSKFSSNFQEMKQIELKGSWFLTVILDILYTFLIRKLLSHYLLNNLSSETSMNAFTLGEFYFESTPYRQAFKWLCIFTHLFY